MSLSWMAWAGSAPFAPRVLFVLIGAAVRGGILLVLAAAVVRLWPRASAAQRHMVWAVACCSLLLLPVLPLVVPAWHMPTLPATTAPVWDRFPIADQQAVPMVVETVDRVVPRGIHAPVSQPRSTFPWLLVILIGWGSGTVVVLAVILESQRRVRRLASEAVPLTDARMLGVLTHAKSTVRLTRWVRVNLHVSTVPLVYGVFRPTIVLPMVSRTWDDERLYHVFLHELAHVRRYDCLTQTVASLACALYWCNPLVWLAMRRLRTEQEQACDDAVLAAGSRPRGYATDLLELTQAFQPTGAMSLAALPFAQPSELQTRMQSILDRSRCRSLVSRWGALAVWSVGLGVMYPLVGLRPKPGGPSGSLPGGQSVAIGRSTTALLAGMPRFSQAQQGCEDIWPGPIQHAANWQQWFDYYVAFYKKSCPAVQWRGDTLVLDSSTTAALNEVPDRQNDTTKMINERNSNWNEIANVIFSTVYAKSKAKNGVPILIEPGAPLFEVNEVPISGLYIYKGSTLQVFARPPGASFYTRLSEEDKVFKNGVIEFYDHQLKPILDAHGKPILNKRGDGELLR